MLHVSRANPLARTGPGASTPRAPAGRPVHPVHAAERPACDPARGPQRPARERQRLVSRRLRAGEAETDGLRAPLRAPDVRGLEARERRRVRHAARSDRRHQQRLDGYRPHELLDRRSVERAGAGALPRIGSHGVSARRDEPGARRRSARRRQERAPPVVRERAVRDGGDRARRNALPGRPSVSLADHRLHGRPHGGELRGRRRFLQAVLRSEQRERRHRRRYRSRADARGGREVVRRRQVGRAGSSDRSAAGHPDGGEETDARGSGPAAAGLPRVADAGAVRAGRRRARYRRAAPDRRQELTAVQAARLRDADRAGRQRVPELRGARLAVYDRSDRQAEGRDRRRAESHRRGAGEAAGDSGLLPRDRAGGQPDGVRVPRRDGGGRRFRRESERAEQLLLRDG